MNTAQVRTIFECLTILNRSITNHTATQEMEQVFMKLMEIQVSIQKDYPPTFIYKEGFCKLEN